MIVSLQYLKAKDHHKRAVSCSRKDTELQFQCKATTKNIDNLVESGNVKPRFVKNPTTRFPVEKTRDDADYGRKLSQISKSNST